MLFAKTRERCNVKGNTSLSPIFYIITVTNHFYACKGISTYHSNSFGSFSIVEDAHVSVPMSPWILVRIGPRPTFQFLCHDDTHGLRMLKPCPSLLAVLILYCDVTTLRCLAALILGPLAVTLGVDFGGEGAGRRVCQYIFNVPFWNGRKKRG